MMFDEYRGDGYVYRDNVRVRKAYTQTAKNVRLWEPGLDRIVQIEAAYAKAEAKVDYWWKDRIQPILEEMLRLGGKAHAKPEHMAEKSPESWWLYTIWDRDNKVCPGELTFDHDWCTAPTELIHPELGQALYHDYYTYFVRSLCRRRGVLRDCLDLALRRRIGAPGKNGQQYRLTFGNRDYWYVAHGALGREQIYELSWPEQATKHIVVVTETRPT
jgi:hypothetical protein